MANSGTLGGNGVSISGYGGNYMFVNWQVASQNIGGNYSTINWQAYFHFQGADAQLDAGSVGSNVGTLWNNGGRVYNYAGNFSTRDLGLASSSFTIGHNADGNQTLSLNCSIAVYQSGTSSGSGSWGLPTIPRYANINSWGFSAAYDTAVTVYVNTDSTCDLIDYQVNGGAWQRGYSGSFTSASFNVGGLVPGTNYSITVRVQRSDSGLYTYSGAQSVTTDTFRVSSFSISNTTDTSLQLNVNTNYTADEFQYRLNGGSWITVNPAPFTSTQTTVTGLTSQTSYTVDVQARDQASQTWSAIATKTATTSFPTPLQSIGLTPSNGVGVGTLSPTLTWQFQSTSPDGQGYYEVILYKQSDGSTVWDSGKIASGQGQATVPAGLLSWYTNYQWKVKTWSDNNIAGTYTSLALFKTSHAPTAVVTAPAASAVVTTDAPQVTWVYGDTNSETQTSFNVTIQKIVNPSDTSGSVIYNQTISNSAATSYTLPAGTLANGSLYLVTVTVTNQDGVQGVSNPVEFSVNFVAPAPPSMTLSLSQDNVYAFITTTTNTPPKNAYDANFVRLYKRKLGETAWNLIGTVATDATYVDTFDYIAGWTIGGQASGIAQGNLYRQNGSSATLEIINSGVATYDKVSTVGSIVGFSKMRLWIFPKNTGQFTSIVFKLGKDSSNYYSFTVNASDLTSGDWNSIETDVNSLAVTGSPTQGNIVWQEILVNATVANAVNDLMVDSWRLIPTNTSMFLFDYELANNTTYEYAVTAYSSEWNLESAKQPYGTPVSITYEDLKNTYLIPVNAQSNALFCFMDGADVPTWAENTPTDYYHPVGAAVPVVYSLGNQQYRTGQATIQFFEDKLKAGYYGITDLNRLKAIMNDKPLMFRTWWGEILYVSIDGQINISREPGVSWKVTFNFTEIASE